MISVEDLQLLDTLARCPTLTAAARMLNVTPPALSMRLKKLETAVGVALAVRSARRLSFTAEGEALATRARDLLEQIEQLPAGLRGGTGALSGRLRISASFGFGRQHLAPLVARFAAAHPGVDISLDMLETPWPDRREVDVVVHIGSVKDSSWVAHPLAPNERWVCASPDYLQACAPPAHPRDLVDHPCICIRENNEDVTLWHYARRVGAASDRTVPASALRVTSSLTTNDGETARRWAEAGLGVVLRSEWDVAESLAHGRLVRLLQEWDFGRPGVLALVPGRKGMSPRVQAFIAFLQDAFRPRPPWRLPIIGP
jgi:DNA-binding transcriptional LysR family regulator